MQTMVQNGRAMMVGGLTALALLAAAPQALAAPQASSEAAAAFRTKQQTYDRLLNEARQATLDLVGQIGEVTQASAGEHDRAPEAASKAWATQMKARVAAMKARIDAAPKVTPTEVQAAFPGEDPAVSAYRALIAQYPTMLRETASVASGLVDAIETSAPAAVNGDRPAQLRLTAAMFEGMRASVAAETLQFQASAALYMSDHPQHALLDSSVASNKALMEFFGVMQKEAQGASDDVIAAARRIRAFSEEGRKAAETAPALAAAMARQIDAQGPAKGPDSKVVVESYRKSADAEIRINEFLAAMAMHLAEDGLTDLITDDWAEIEALVDKRAQLDQERRAIFSR